MCGRVITAFLQAQHHSWPWIMTPGGSPGLGEFAPGIRSRRSMFGMRLFGVLPMAAAGGEGGGSNLYAENARAKAPKRSSCVPAGGENCSRPVFDSWDRSGLI